MQYRMIVSYDEDDLSRVVSELLAKGWQLHGPPQIAIYYADDMLHSRVAQAVVKFA